MEGWSVVCWKPERGFIKGWGIYKEVQWLSCVLWKMKVFPQATHGHFHSFYWFPHHPICLSTHNQSFARADTAAEAWPAGGECASVCEPVCVCVCVCVVCVSQNIWVIQVSFLPSESLWSGGVHCGFATSTVSGFVLFCKGFLSPATIPWCFCNLSALRKKC